MEPWYKVATPRKEVREGRSFNPNEFAIALEDERQRDVDLNPGKEAMRREVARLQLEVARLSRQLAGPGTPSAPRASRASRTASPRGPR